MLAGGGFDPALDIEALTINRWPHGYTYDYENPLWNTPEEIENPGYVRGRQRFGRISIANTDAGGRAYLDCAIDEAHRAVTELG
jgi:spermidine dehydrogenase